MNTPGIKGIHRFQGKNWWKKVQPEGLWPAYEDFSIFLSIVWQHLGLPSPTPIQKNIARYLQNCPRRTVIEAFRGVGKSWITSVYCCWLLLRNPQLKILVVSASQPRADDFSTFTLRLISEFPLLRHLTPTEEQRQAKVAFDVSLAGIAHAPSVRSRGILGQITGSRADYIIADDIEIPNNSETQPMRDKISERVKEFESILKPEGYITFLGTPQCENSIYNVLSDRNYCKKIWPAQYPVKNKEGYYQEFLAEYLLKNMEEEPSLTIPQFNVYGEATDPDRFDLQDLQERYMSYGQSGYALQFMLDTRLSDERRYPLKLSDLIVYDCDDELGPEKLIWSNAPNCIINELPCVGLGYDRYYRPSDFLRDENGNVRMHKYSGSVMAIDPSGRGADEAVALVLKFLNGYIFLVDISATREGYGKETLTTFAQMAKKNQVNAIIVESNFGDGIFTELLRPVQNQIYPCHMEEVRHSTMKEKRICDTLEPIINNHKLVIDPKVIEYDYRDNKNTSVEQAQQYRLAYQLTRIQRVKGALRHDDRIDCLAIGVNYFVEQVSVDTEKRIKENALERAQIIADEFMSYNKAGIQQWMH